MEVLNIRERLSFILRKIQDQEVVREMQCNDMFREIRIVGQLSDDQVWSQIVFLIYSGDAWSHVHGVWIWDQESILKVVSDFKFVESSVWSLYNSRIM
jgi:hypothetical protein